MAEKKRGCLGCSFPVLIIVLVIFLGLLFVGFAAGPVGKGFGININVPSWVAPQQPAPELPAETVFHIGALGVTNTMLAAWLTTAFLAVMCWLITRKMKLIPGRLQMVFEFLLGWVYNFCETVAGEKNVRTFFPLVCTIFLFVMFNAYLGLLPFFGSVTWATEEGAVHILRPANTDINVPLALALITFVMTWYFGFKKHGFGYLSQFFQFGPLFRDIGKMFTGKTKFNFMSIFNGAINIFVGLLEFISQLIRVLSLTFRLFGNMTAGEILLLMMTFLVPFLVSDFFYTLELLIGFVQALVFGGLTLVYLSMAEASHSEEHQAESH